MGRALSELLIMQVPRTDLQLLVLAVAGSGAPTRKAVFRASRYRLFCSLIKAICHAHAAPRATEHSKDNDSSGRQGNLPRIHLTLLVRPGDGRERCVAHGR